MTPSRKSDQFEFGDFSGQEVTVRTKSGEIVSGEMVVNSNFAVEIVDLIQRLERLCSETDVVVYNRKGFHAGSVKDLTIGTTARLVFFSERSG